MADKLTKSRLAGLAALVLALGLALFGLAVLGSHRRGSDGTERVGFPLAICEERIVPVQLPCGADDPIATIEPGALPVNLAAAFLAAALVPGMAWGVRRFAAGRLGPEEPARQAGHGGPAKIFGSVLLGTFAIFGLATVASYFLRSAGLGLFANDADSYIGFPAVLCRQGGWVNVVCKEGRHIYTAVALRAMLLDVAAAMLVAVPIGLLIPRWQRGAAGRAQ